VSEDLAVEFGVVVEQLWHGAVFGAPCLVDWVALLTSVEAVVRKQFAAVARRQNDLVPLALLASPVLQGLVQWVVDETGFDSIFGHDVTVQALLVCDLPCRGDTDNATDYGADSVGSDDKVVLCCDAVVECDGVGLEVDCSALEVRVSFVAIGLQFL
jgi:hypothetical protein